MKFFLKDSIVYSAIRSGPSLADLWISCRKIGNILPMKETCLKSLLFGAGKPRGFAFAGFTCRVHAERAIALANGKVIFSP